MDVEPERIRSQEFFRAQGYLRVPHVFDETTCLEVKEAVFDFLGISDVHPVRLAEYETKRYRAVQDVPHVRDVATHNALIDVVSGIIGPNIALTLNRHNHVSVNPPYSEQAPLHRDHGEWSRGLLTAIVYLEDSTNENGTTHIIPGSHTWYSIGHAQNGGYWLSDSEAHRHLGTQALPVPMNAGDVLLFDGHLYHGAGPNISQKTRTSIALGYHAVDQLRIGHETEQMLVVAGDDVYRGNDKET